MNVQLRWRMGAAVLGLMALTGLPGRALAGADANAGDALFAQRCASCHEGVVPRAPNRSLLELLSPAAIYAALTSGVMQQQAQGLDPAQRTAIAEYLAGRSLDAAPAVAVPYCKRSAGWFDRRQGASGVGWGVDRENTRLVPGSVARLSARDVPRLELAWAFAFPDVTRASSEPLVAGSAVFVGSQDGNAYALDARSGCVHWIYHGGGEIRGAMVISMHPPGGAPTLYFGDNFGVVHALDAATGALRWKRRVDEHSAARVYGTPVLLARHGGLRLYVPVASFEEVAASTATYPCCTFRGSIVALDAASGQPLWQTYTIPYAAVEQGRTALGGPRFGPSGAGVWSSPTVDLRRGALYFSTGNNYSAPADGNSDAVFAIDLDSGAVRWRRQMLAGDADNMSCYAPTPGSRFSLGNDVNCPKSFGPDLDLTGPPVLVHGPRRRDILVAGQKSGETFGLDPDHQGRLVWSTRLSRGSALTAGGFFFGLAAEAGRVYVPLLDFPMSYFDPKAPAQLAGSAPRDGLYALDAWSGHLLWSASAREYCKRAACAGNQAAALAIPGVVFAGAADGMLRAFDSASGRALWEYDSIAPVTTVSGVRAHGGTISGSGIMVAGGTVFVNSGYGGISGAPGNVLLALRPRPRAATPIGRRHVNPVG